MTLRIAIPENVVLSTRQSHKLFEMEAKRAIALKFYCDEKLSLGQAAEFADFSKFEFMRYLGENQVSVFRFDDMEDLRRDTANAEGFSHE